MVRTSPAKLTVPELQRKLKGAPTKKALSSYKKAGLVKLYREHVHRHCLKWSPAKYSPKKRTHKRSPKKGRKSPRRSPRKSPRKTHKRRSPKKAHRKSPIKRVKIGKKTVGVIDLTR